MSDVVGMAFEAGSHNESAKESSGEIGERRPSLVEKTKEFIEKEAEMVKEKVTEVVHNIEERARRPSEHEPTDPEEDAALFT